MFCLIRECLHSSSSIRSVAGAFAVPHLSPGHLLPQPLCVPRACPQIPAVLGAKEVGWRRATCAQSSLVSWVVAHWGFYLISWSGRTYGASEVKGSFGEHVPGLCIQLRMRFPPVTVSALLMQHMDLSWVCSLALSCGSASFFSWQLGSYWVLTEKKSGQYSEV